MGFFSSLIGDVGELFSDTASNLGEMGGNIVGGVAQGLEGAIKDPMVQAALAAAGMYYLGGGTFTDGTFNYNASQAAAQAGIPAETLSAAMGAEGLAAPATLGSTTPAAAIGAGVGGETAAALGADFAGANALAPTAAAGAAGAAGAGAAGANAMSSYLTPAAIAGSALLGANAAQNAAETQAAAQQRANDLIYKMYQEQVGLQAPFRQAGLTAQNRMLDLLGLSANTGAAGYGSLNKPFGMEQFQADPGYAFRLSEGVKALERSRAQAGGLLSGGTGKALTRYGQDLASQEYGNAFSRYQTERANQLNPLAALTAAGQGSANVLGTAAGNYGKQAGEGITDIARAQAAGNLGMSNALAGGVTQYLGYLGNQDLANAIAQSRQSQYRPY